MPRQCGARPEFLHQAIDALISIARADAHAPNVQVNLAPAAIHGVDLRVHALIAVTHQGGDRLFELFDGQAVQFLVGWLFQVLRRLQFFNRTRACS